MGPAWRLIVDGRVNGALNMALDRAAQLAREEGSVAPTLRLYGWSRPTASLGRFQRADAVDASFAQAEGIDVVRRFTGGRGVLHDDEVTYCVVASKEDGVPRGVVASYRHISGALARAYRTLGVPAELVSHDRSSSRSEACYLSATRADLSLGTRKLSGSAQVWSGSTVMQHGSFVLSRNLEREADLFGLSPEDRARLGDETVTLEDAEGALPKPADVVEAVVDAFRCELGIRFEPGGWTARECEIASALVELTTLRG